MKKILIIPGGLQIGGAEKVAAEVCCYAPKYEFEFQYLVFEGEENVYGADIELHGGKVFYWPSPSKNYKKYIKNLNSLMRKEHYYAVHSHTMFNSGINLWAAKKNHVPVRIAHSHTTKTEHTVSLLQKVYECVMRKLLQKLATHYFACGEAAGEWLFGKRFFSKYGKIIHNGIDTQKYRFSEENRKKIRTELKMTDSFIIGHAGTLLPLKNQEFLIRIMPDISKRIPNAMLLLLGAGEDEQVSYLENLIADCKMEKHVFLCGGVLNVHEYLSAFDVFTFPSLREGTPLALLEAQVNGLPCIVSDAVPKDAFVSDLVRTLPLEAKEPWVEAVCTARRRNSTDYVKTVRNAGYDIHDTYAPVYEAYRGNKKSALFAFSFDDGRADNYFVAEKILSPRGIPATFNITSGYVDGSCPMELRPTDCAAMTVDNVKELSDNQLFEIALHGNNHLNTIEDIVEGRRKIIEWLNKKTSDQFGFASPGSGLKIGNREFLLEEPFKSEISYVRVGLRYKTMAFLRIFVRKVGRVIHLPVFFRFAYADTLMNRSDGKVIYSVPVMGDITANQVIGLVNLCIRRKEAMVLMLHSIEEYPSDTWSWQMKKFQKLCDFLIDQIGLGNLKITTVSQLYDEIR